MLLLLRRRRLLRLFLSLSNEQKKITSQNIPISTFAPCLLSLFHRFSSWIYFTCRAFFFVIIPFGCLYFIFFLLCRSSFHSDVLHAIVGISQHYQRNLSCLRQQQQQMLCYEWAKRRTATRGRMRRGRVTECGGTTLTKIHEICVKCCRNKKKLCGQDAVLIAIAMLTVISSPRRSSVCRSLSQIYSSFLLNNRSLSLSFTFQYIWTAEHWIYMNTTAAENRRKSWKAKIHEYEEKAQTFCSTSQSQ